VNSFIITKNLYFWSYWDAQSFNNADMASKMQTTIMKRENRSAG
jgi:hypothetical protein